MILLKAAVTAGLSLAAVAAVTDPGPAADAQGRAAVEAWLKELMGDEAPPFPPKIVPVEAEALRRVYPAERFYAVRFMRYPRALRPPRPLRLENLVRVRPDGTVAHIPSLEALEQTLATELAGAGDEARARDAALASLRLAEEFFQDGYYTFRIPEQRVAVARRGDSLVASAEAEVVKGGTGAIAATLRFGPGGVLAVDLGELDGRSVRPDVRLR